jgi:hypothetical protein
MKNCLQTIILAGHDPDELQESLNSRLVPLGKDVKSVQIVNSGSEYMAVVTYESLNLDLEIRKKVEAIQTVENPDPTDPIRVLVMFGSEFDRIAFFLSQYKRLVEQKADDPEMSDFLQDKYAAEAEILEQLINKLETGDSNSQGGK